MFLTELGKGCRVLLKYRGPGVYHNTQSTNSIGVGPEAIVLDQSIGRREGLAGRSGRTLSSARAAPPGWAPSLGKLSPIGAP